jgi:transposase-like protein
MQQSPLRFLRDPCRDVEELLAEYGIDVDHVTVYRWGQRFTRLLADAGGPCRRTIGEMRSSGSEAV